MPPREGSISDSGTAVATLPAWQEWKARCALDLCGEAARHALRTFASMRFQHFLHIYGRHALGRKQVLPPLEPAQMWHLFETHLIVTRTQAGKVYKEWLFARLPASDGDRTEDVVQGGATLIMRDVVREYLRREVPPPAQVSLDNCVNGRAEGGEALTFADLLPDTVDPADEVARRELDDLAARYAVRVFAEMNHRERIALLARELGWSLAHPLVTRCAGCGKSVLNGVWHAFHERVLKRFRREYADDDRQTVLLLALGCIENVRARVLDWGRSDAGCVLLLAGQGGEPRCAD